MSKFYIVVSGDTFDLISRKQYGIETNADLLRRSNPSQSEPLIAGTSLVIPNDPNAPTDLVQLADGITQDDVSLLIDNVRFEFWTRISITRSIDSMDVVEFDAPFDPDLLEQRELFRPFSYKSITVYVGDEPFFTGVMMGVTPRVTPTSKTVTITAYSSPGVLNDCPAPASSYPIEFNGLNLEQIANTLASPFGIGVEFLSDPGPVFDRVALNTGRKVLDFLADLAKQRNLIISSSERGTLRFWNSTDTLQAEAILSEESAPLTSIEPSFNPQSYYSDVTGINPTGFGKNGTQFTVKNPLLPDVVRPFVFNADDATDSNLKAAVEAKIGRMFGNMVSYTAQVSTWRDPSDFLWEPNSNVIVKAPGAMIYEEFTFLIRSIQFIVNDQSKIANLTIVIPGAFSGQIPESLPWDE